MNQTDELNAIQTMDIPDDAEIKVAGGMTWRFSRGKIVSGEENPPKSGNFDRQTKRLVGKLLRVGIHDGVGKRDGQPYKQIECDLLMKDGSTQFVKAGLNDPEAIGRIELKPSVSAIKFAWALTQYDKGEVVMLEASLSKDPVTLPSGRKGDHVTYVNCFRVVGSNATPIYSPKIDKTQAPKTLVQQWLELEPLIKAHPAFAPRPERSHDDDGGAAAVSHYSNLVKLCHERKWASPDQAPGDWLELMRRAFQEDAPRARTTDWDDDKWGEALHTIGGLQTVPKSIEEATARLYAKQTTIEL